MADTLTVTDNRTGKQYEIAIKDGVIRATDLRQVKSGARSLLITTRGKLRHSGMANPTARFSGLGRMRRFAARS